MGCRIELASHFRFSESMTEKLHHIKAKGAGHAGLHFIWPVRTQQQLYNPFTWASSQNSLAEVFKLIGCGNPLTVFVVCRSPLICINSSGVLGNLYVTLISFMASTAWTIVIMKLLGRNFLLFFFGSDITKMKHDS